tara:strand:+ start:10764 stop:11624 length:861 start_codon:yes stop_codon:yes gene_type:complete
MSNFSIQTEYLKNDQIKLIFDLSNNASGTPTVDLQITLSEASSSTTQTLYNQTGIAAQNGITVEATITINVEQSPMLNFDFQNSSAGDFTWGVSLQVFKKIEQVFESIPKRESTTIAWNEDIQRWTSRYSYKPEYFSTFKTGISSFKNGALYIHDDTVNKNYFYGGFFPTYVSYIENEAPSQPKVFLTHSVEGTSGPNYTTFETIENNKMNSDLLSTDYERKEGTYYSELFGDTNDPNIEGSYGDKLLKGTKLRGQYLKVGVSFRDNNLEVKHSNIGFITSKGHNT